MKSFRSIRKSIHASSLAKSSSFELFGFVRFNKHVLSACYMSGSILSAGDAVMTETCYISLVRAENIERT